MKSWLLCVSSVLLLSTTILEARLFKVERWETSNGAKVVFYQAHEVPMLDVDVAFAAGSAYDGKHFGLSALTTELLNQGNGAFNANQIADQLADKGAQFFSSVSRDMALLQLKALNNEQALDQSIQTLSLVINKPQFKQEAFNRIKAQQMGEIVQMQESPSEVANQVFFNKLYQEHPYAHSVNGTLDTIKPLKAYQAQAFYKKYFVASNAIIIMVGAIDSDKAHRIAEKLVQGLPQGSPAKTIPKAAPLVTHSSVDVPFPSSQTFLRLGQVGIDHRVANYFPLMVGNYILGGGTMVSRLGHEVREKRGLTYGVDSQLLPMPGDGPFLISLSTQNKAAQQALDVTKDTLENFLSKGPTEIELAAAKNYLMGSFPLSLASNSSIAGMLLRMAFYHLPDNYLDTYTARIESVSVADIKKAFNTEIHPDRMLHVSVGTLQPLTT